MALIDGLMWPQRSGFALGFARWGEGLD